MGRAEDLFEKIKKEGESAIDDFLLTRKSEELFLDFKRSADEGSGKILHSDDRENLSKAISGFGNSEGGVIVWGVYCTKDKLDPADIPRRKHPIKDVKKFVSFLESAISVCTIPPHYKVQNYPVVINRNDEGFVITYIPKSVHAPHQVVKDYKYYMRAGSSFMPVTHGILAGMFGRRPQPHVFHSFFFQSPDVINEKRIKITIGFVMHNEGPGLASDLFMNIMISDVPGENCETSLLPTDNNNWISSSILGMKVNTISRPDIRLAPDAEIMPLLLTLWLLPPFTNSLEINGLCGCGQSPAYKFKIGNKMESIKMLYDGFIVKHEKGLLTKEYRDEFLKEVLKTEQERNEM